MRGGGEGVTRLPGGEGPTRRGGLCWRAPPCACAPVRARPRACAPSRRASGVHSASLGGPCVGSRDWGTRLNGKILGGSRPSRARTPGKLRHGHGAACLFRCTAPSVPGGGQPPRVSWSCTIRHAEFVPMDCTLSRSWMADPLGLEQPPPASRCGGVATSGPTGSVGSATPPAAAAARRCTAVHSCAAPPRR